MSEKKEEEPKDPSPKPAAEAPTKKAEAPKRPLTPFVLDAPAMYPNIPTPTRWQHIFDVDPHTSLLADLFDSADPWVAKTVFSHTFETSDKYLELRKDIDDLRRQVSERVRKLQEQAAHAEVQ